MATKTNTVTTCDWCGTEETTDASGVGWYQVQINKIRGKGSVTNRGHEDIGPECYDSFRHMIDGIKADNRS